VALNLYPFFSANPLYTRSSNKDTGCFDKHIVEGALQRAYILKYVTTEYPHDTTSVLNIDEMVVRNNLCVHSISCRECELVLKHSKIYAKNKNIPEADREHILYSPIKSDAVFCESHTSMASIVIQKLYSLIKPGTVYCRSPSFPNSLYMFCASKPSLTHTKDS
jgi:hypothetical protein